LKTYVATSMFNPEETEEETSSEEVEW
jgi:hypothetical protein